ncbi:cytochrome P450 4c3-like [Lycorma delicatula]|uniref:cytochrome P450 4c3-like n=1 Tax=Lycorma delicatula TaxID=130591 RepID=UPI003F518F42
MLHLLIIIITLFITLYIWNKWKICRMERFASQIPGPDGLPIIGNLFVFLGKSNFESLEIMKMASVQFKDEFLVKFWFGNYLMISSLNPKVMEVLISKADNKGEHLNFFHVLSRGIVFISEHKWKIQRKFVSKMFYPHLYENYINIFNEKSCIIVEKLMEITLTKNYGISQSTMCCAWDIICCVAMGVDIDAVRTGDNTPIRNALDAVELIFKRLNKPWLWMDFVYYMTEDGKRMSKAVNQFHSYILQLINKRRQIRSNEEKENKDKNYINNGNERKFTYLDIKLEHAERNNISDKQLAYEFELVIAGSDTVSTVTSFTLLMLAIHTEWQEKVHKELDEFYGDSDCNVTVNEINNMEILDLLVKEAMRLCIIPNSMRQLDEDTKCGGYIIPAGTMVYIPTHLLHFDSRYWSHPDEFHPEHFLPENVAKRPKGSYIPFHTGPRQCPGYKYGLFLVKIMLVHILRKFKLTTELKYENLKYKVKLMIEIDGGYCVQLHKRK